MKAKTKAIVSYITLIGWIIGISNNEKPKQELASVHIRQMLGLMIFQLSTGLIFIVLGILFFFASPILYSIAIIQSILLVFWVIGLIMAILGKDEPVPVLGFFQKWFKTL